MNKIVQTEFVKENKNLQRAEIMGGNWIDAGCGQGAYTIPLAMIADSVLAIDKNTSPLKSLEKRIIGLGLTNINIKKDDLQNIENYKRKNVQGILFAFSLHYQQNIDFILQILEKKQEEKNFKIVIIEYTREKPIFWVPYPYPPEIVQKLFEERKKYKTTVKFRNDRYYILEITKS